MNDKEIEEIGETVYEMYTPGVIDEKTKKEKLKGYRYVKSYDFGPYEWVTVQVYKAIDKETKPRYKYVVIYNGIGVKAVVDHWKKAESMAKQIVKRNKMIERMLG